MPIDDEVNHSKYFLSLNQYVSNVPVITIILKANLFSGGQTTITLTSYDDELTASFGLFNATKKSRRYNLACDLYLSLIM